METISRAWPFTAPIRWIQAQDRRLGRSLRPYGRWAVVLHEFVCFGVKQASACLFGGLMLVLLLLTWRWYPVGLPLARYDFLTLAALSLQVALIALKLETREEVRVILLFHLVGTGMEVFKTAMGSWSYPEASLLRIGGVPLFSGFMYGAVGSYIARAWRLFDFRFTRHPPLRATVVLALAIYANFFAHHFLPDARLLLFALTVLLFGRCRIHFRIRQKHRQMPLLLGFVLVALFIWFAENLGTWSRAWLYPSQQQGWNLVSPAKLGAWLLLMIISYVMVYAVHSQPRPVAANARRRYTFALRPPPATRRGQDVPQARDDRRL